MNEKPSLLRRLDATHLPMIAARLVLGNLFILYGFHKIGDPVDFLKLIKEYELLPLEPPEYMNLAAVITPWLEVICGNLLLAGLWIRGAAFTILAMLVVFTTAIVIRAMGVYAAGGVDLCDIKFDCGCGGGEIIICKKVLMNSALIALSVVALLSRSRKLAIDTLPEPANVNPTPEPATDSTEEAT